MKKWLLILTWSLSAAAAEFPQPAAVAQKSYICYRPEVPIKVDGRLNETSWQKAAWTDWFVDIEGTVRPAPRFRTRAKLLWDETFLYVGAELEEPDVWATLRMHDSIIFMDNDFEVFIDPDGDTHRYFELEVNSFGTCWDLFLDRPYRDGGRAFFYWEMYGMRCSTRVDGTNNRPGDVDRGWTVELALPMQALKEGTAANRLPAAGDQWRINFSRVEWQTQVKDGRYEKVIDPRTGKSLPEDNWVWSPQGLVNMHYPEQWGYLQFSNQITGEGTEAFVLDPLQAPRQLLRNVYYAEQQYWNRNSHFTADWADLGLERPEGHCDLQVTSGQFLASFATEKGKLFIDHLGRIWIESAAGSKF